MAIHCALRALQAATCFAVGFNMLVQFPSQRQSKILVLDDEPLIADSLAMILIQSGYEARAAYNGSSAIVVAQSWRPDLLLADIIMPGMNGVEAALEISSLVPECRLLFISGDLSTADLLDGYRNRGHDFHALCKPVPPADLLIQISRAFAPLAP